MSVTINDYHAKRALWFKTHDLEAKNQVQKDGVLYLGSEVECDVDGVRWNSDSLDRILHGCGFLPFFIPTRDGSLHNGVEFVSYPCTLRGWMARRSLIEDGFKALVDAGLRSHDTETCGLHVHVSNVMGEVGRKNILVMVENNWPAITAFARRSGSKYAKEQFQQGPNGKLSRDIAACAKDGVVSANCSDRYMAINFTTGNTVEFRMFKGTLNPITFFATLQFVDNISRLSAQISSADALRVDFMDIVRYREWDELNEYIAGRDITSNKKCQWKTSGKEE